MAKQKLNYRFHNPNTVEETAAYIINILIEANKEKVARIIKSATESTNESETHKP